MIRYYFKSINKLLFALSLIVNLCILSGCSDKPGKTFSMHEEDGRLTVTLEAEKDLNHDIGYKDGDGWASDENQGSGYMISGPDIDILGEGGAQANFKILLDAVNSESGEVARIDILDATKDEVLIERIIYRNDFSGNFQYQDISLFFNLIGRAGNDIRIRVYSFGLCYILIDSIILIVDRFQQGLPQIQNYSDSSDSHILTLIKKAIDGLGFPSDRADAPNKKDILFAGKYYLAWIDQTGFYGKMNGLWLLNGESGNSLNFVQFDRGRPYNFLAVAEKGDGKWLENYTGAEHFELPHIVNEGNDIRYCESNLCNWYSMNEADTIDGDHLPHWKACSPGAMSWSQFNSPIIQNSYSDGIKLVYRGPLTKEGDGDMPKDGDYCHANMLFSDGLRRPLYLRIGYRLYGDKPYIDRTYQYDNPNNIDFGSKEVGTWGLIHGILITSIEGGIQTKLDLRDYIRPNEKDMHRNEQIYPQDVWSYVNPGIISRDDVWAWLGQSFTLSSNESSDAAFSIHHAHVAEEDNNDLGLCSCVVHGALEFGGGVLHGNPEKPVPGNGLSFEAIKRIGFPQGVPMDDIVNGPLSSK